MQHLISVVRNLTIVAGQRTIRKIYEAIISTLFEVQTATLRTYLKNGETNKYTEAKKRLLAATFSCKLEGGRKAENIVEYSRLVCLDFDKIDTPMEVEHCRQIINDMPYTRLSFVSPSGFGLKVVVEVNSGIEDHKNVYLQVAKHYEDEIGHPADKTSDVNRLCFLPHDDKAYLNEASEIFVYRKEENQVKKPVVSNGECQSLEIFEYALVFTMNKKQFIEGERNAFIFLLASNCNRYGLCKDYVADMCIERFAEAGFESKEISDCVASAYKSENQFNTWKRPNKQKKENYTFLPDSDMQESVYASTPFFDEFVHANLPPLIRDTAELFLDQRSRDMYVLTYITVLSAYAYLNRGWYDQNWVRPNLFSFIVANPASGKSAMRKVEELFKAVENTHKLNGVTVQPPKNTFKSLIKQLSQKGGLGALYDEEVEVFGRMFKHDKVSISYFIKKGYDNGEISASGKETTNEFIISESKFSFVTGGNLDQIGRLANTVTDGTRSRLNFYCFGEATPIRNPKPGGWKDFIDQQEDYLQKLAAFIKYMQTYPFEFKLTDEQFAEIQVEENELLKTYNAEVDIAMDSVIKRAGITLFRIAILLSSYRRFAEGNTDSVYTCSDTDFKVSLSMAKTLVAHSHFAGEVLKRDGSISLQDNLQAKQFQILKEVPECFSRKEAVFAVKKIGLKISDRTIDNYLQRMQINGLVTHSHDKYCKQVA